MWVSDDRSAVTQSTPAPAGADAATVLRALVMSCSCLCATTTAQPCASSRPRNSEDLRAFNVTVAISFVAVVCLLVSSFLYAPSERGIC